MHARCGTHDGTRCNGILGSMTNENELKQPMMSTSDNMHSPPPPPSAACFSSPARCQRVHDVCMGSKRLSAPKTGMRCAGLPLVVSAAPETEERAEAAVAAQQMLPDLLLPPAFTRVEHVCAQIAQPMSAALAVDRAAVVVASQTLPPC